MPHRPRNRATPESIALGQRLQQALTKSGKSQADLARALDVNRQTIQQLVAGYNDNPSFRRIVRIADELGVRARWLGSGEGEMLPTSAALAPLEADLIDMIRQMPKDRQAEVIGFCRGIAESQRSSRRSAASALSNFIDSMDADEAAKLSEMLSLMQAAKTRGR